MAESKQLALTEEQVLLIAKALADPRRYQILKQLGDHQRGVKCSSVRDCLDISPATLSHHMKELETAGLVQAERKGKFVAYLLRRDVIEAFYRRLQADLA